MPVIVFRFSGGIRDGQVIRSDQLHAGENEADRLWRTTWNGTLGRRFDVANPAGPSYSRYQVRGRYDLGDEIHVTCESVD